MEGGLLLDVVVRKRVTVVELPAGKDKILLSRWDAVLDLSLHTINCGR